MGEAGGGGGPVGITLAIIQVAQFQAVGKGSFLKSSISLNSHIARDVAEARLSFQIELAL